MQYQPQPSYQGSYQASGGFPDSQYHGNQTSFGYGAQSTNSQAHANADGYGTHGATPTYPSAQNPSYGSASGSYSDGRASKRPRLDTGDVDDTPTRSSGSWAPLAGGQSQHTGQQRRGGLALPPMRPPSRPANDHPQQPAQQDSQVGAQQSHTGQISLQLESQVRGLAGYDSSSVRHPYDDAPPRMSPTSHHSAGRQSGLGSGPVGPMQPQRGARPGETLNLSCVMCMKKKRKCSKHFPCNECEKFGEECVPSVRKVRPSTLAANKDQDAPHEEDPQDPAASTEQADYNTPAERVVKDQNDNRRYLLNLPRVVDGYQQWANMSLPYHPFPDNLDEVRDIIFNLEKPILLNSQQYADYWPHVSNIYARGVGPWWDTNGVQLETWECRNQRRQSRHQRVKGPGGQGLRKRERKLHLLEGTEMCRLRFRLHAFIRHANDGAEEHKKGLGNCNCVPDWLFLERMRASHEIDHNHTLDALDKYKRTDAILFFAERKVAEGGYLYAAVRKWIHSNYSRKTKALKYLTDHDVANAARRWRVQNRELELLDTIPDPNPDDERQDMCLKLLPTTKEDGLRQALREICNQLPEAAKIALQILETSQIAEAEPSKDSSKIAQGDEIVIPRPGIPGHRFNTLYKNPTPPQKPTEPARSPSNSDGSVAPGPRPPSSQTQHMAVQGPPQSGQQPAEPPPQPLPPPPLPAQSQMPPLSHMPPPPPMQSRFHVYQPPSQATPTPSGPIMGNYSVISGSHRVQIPAAGSKMVPSADSRPSWAKPSLPPALPSNLQNPVSKASEEQKKENEQMRVKQQLEAELQG